MMALLWDLEIGAEIMNSQIEMHSGAVIIFDWYQGERKPLKVPKAFIPHKNYVNIFILPFTKFTPLQKHPTN